MVVKQGESFLESYDLVSVFTEPGPWDCDPSQVSLGVFLPFWVGKDGQSLLELVISLSQVSQTLMTPQQAG